MKYARIILLLWMLAACGSNATPQGAVDLPTVAELPTLTPTESAVPTLTSTATLTTTSTLTPSSTPSETASVTPSATITDTPTSTPTITPSPTPRQSALLLLAQLADHVTVLPQELMPPVATPLPAGINQSLPPVGTTLPTSCAETPPGGFATLFYGTTTLAGQLGCPVGTITNANSAMQLFEHGSMIWVSGPIYVLYSDGRFQRYDDTFVDGVDPASGGETAPSGLVEPVRGFGKVWRSNPEVRNGLGWGTLPEGGGSAVMQRFERGWMIDLSQRTDILVLIENSGGLSGTWQSFAGGY